MNFARRPIEARRDSQAAWRQPHADSRSAAAVEGLATHNVDVVTSDSRAELFGVLLAAQSALEQYAIGQITPNLSNDPDGELLSLIDTMRRTGEQAPVDERRWIVTRGSWWRWAGTRTVACRCVVAEVRERNSRPDNGLVRQILQYRLWFHV